MSGTTPVSKTPAPSQQAAMRRRSNRVARLGRRRDAAAILLALSLSLSLSLVVRPHPETSAGEMLYYAFYNVAIGALIGTRLFDRLPKDGFALFAVRAASALLLGTLVNEMFVERLLFGMEPINGVGVYYGLTDALFWTVIFILFRLAERLPAFGQDRSEAPSGALVADADWLFVRVTDGTRRIRPSDVVFMAAERDFTRLVCADTEHFVSESLKSLIERSAALGFVRVHKSYAVNLGRVDRVAPTEVQLGDRRVPLGRRYRAGFRERWRSR